MDRPAFASSASPGSFPARAPNPSAPQVRDAVAFLFAALAAIFLARVFYGREAAPLPIENLDIRPPRFDTVRAMADVRSFVSACPRRVTGSDGARCAARFIETRFRDLGFAVRTQTFPMWLRGRRVTGRNVLGFSPGTSTRTMVLLAHYDASATSSESAADNASGVATLLELARIFSGETHARSILFLATDGSEWGMIGADRFASAQAWKAFPGTSGTPPYGAISLDFVKSGIARGITLQGSGQFDGYTPLWLRRLVAGAIRAAGIRVWPEAPPWQIVARALRVSYQDQGPLLRHGIPAINLSTFASDPAGARRVYHTDADRTGLLLPGALGLYGRAAEAAAYALVMAGVTSSEDALTLTARKVLPASSLRWIALSLFLPLLVLTASTIARRPAGLVRGALRVAALALPLIAALLALRLSALANFLPRFELYPATPKDPFLTSWQPGPMIVSLAVAALAAVLAARAPRGTPSALRAAALVGLSAAALWAWGRNDVAAALFLAPAAWLWPWIGTAGGVRGHMLDAILLLGGTAPFVVLLALFGRMIDLGSWILWYVPLQVAYGVFTLHAAAIAGLALAAAIALVQATRPASPDGGGNTILA